VQTQARDRLLHSLAVMSAQVVYDHDMTRAQDRRQDVLASQRRAGFPLERMAAYICGWWIQIILV